MRKSFGLIFFRFVCNIEIILVEIFSSSDLAMRSLLPFSSLEIAERFLAKGLFRVIYNFLKLNDDYVKIARFWNKHRFVFVVRICF